MTFGGGAEGASINGVAGVRATFGEGPHLDSYIRLLKATRAILTISEAFYIADEGSDQEAVASEALRRMIDGLLEYPDKAASLVESLAALTVHLKLGGTCEEWFEGLDEGGPE